MVRYFIEISIILFISLFIMEHFEFTVEFVREILLKDVDAARVARVYSKALLHFMLC